MQRIVLLVTLLICVGKAETIGIDVDAISRIVNIPPVVKHPESVVEVVPVEKIPMYGETSKSVEDPIYSTRSKSQAINEETRDGFIKALRVALEKGREFKYYYPNFDYGQLKKELEQMMRDAVAQ